MRRDPELDGGALMDVGCYCVSALRLLCGEPERVSAEAVTGPTGVDERVVATLRFPGDVLGTLDCAMDASQHASLELVGTVGRLLVADPWPVPRAITVRREGGSRPAPSPTRSSSSCRSSATPYGKGASRG